MAQQLYADVMVEVEAVKLDRKFQYRVPDKLKPLLRYGQRVRVPFGGRQVTGFIIGITGQQTIDNVKEILSIVDEKPYFRPDQLALAKWIADYYFCSTVRALHTVIAPVLSKTSSKTINRYFINIQDKEWTDLHQNLARRAPKSLAVLNAARANYGLTKLELAEVAGATPSVVDRLVAKGLLRVETETPYRDPYPFSISKIKKFRLTPEQKKAVQDITVELKTAKYRAFMLHGITGSGKTEVYLRCIEQVLQLGRQAIVLVPEISLTPQMVRLFKARFGQDVAVLHSRMSNGERYDEWVRIERGEAPVVLGTRSAILAPTSDPGLIIIDEEHEWSYKQEETPRYHARAVAIYRAQKNGGVLVLGSATPSLETYCRALPGGVYKQVKLSKRIDDRIMPKVHVIDMRQEVRSGNAEVFSLELLQKIKEKLHNKEQVIIFLNRRGFKTLVVCRECGLVLKCPRCEISLTYHNDKRLRCHYCNYLVNTPRLCPDCSGREIGYFGTGTQLVEQELNVALPDARILRLDADTTTRKGSHQYILDNFSNGGADILVGTQMIAKGLDLPGVTLVGVINADVSLHMPDFRAAERTFQLLTQVAGRAGRGDKPGEVLIQTYTPEHYAVQAAAHHDFNAFFKHEIKLRKQMGYPPFAKMVRMLVYGKNESAVQQGAELLHDKLHGFACAADGGKIFIVGPAPAPLARLKEKYRWHVIVWSADYRLLRLVIEELWRSVGGVTLDKGLHMVIDVDPMNIM